MNIGDYIDEIEARANRLHSLYPSVAQIGVARIGIAQAHIAMIGLVTTLDKLNRTLLDIESSVK